MTGFVLERRLPFLIVLLLTLMVGGAFVPALVAKAQEGQNKGEVVEEVRVGQDHSRTRIVLEFNKEMGQKIAYRWFTLPDPARIVVDFGDIVFSNSPNLVKLPDDSLVKGLRAGLFRPGTVRMVLDLSKAGRVNVFDIPGGPAHGPRLVVDVVPVKKGEKPTNVPPPEDVVEAGKAPVVNPTSIEQEPAPVVPPQVTQPVQKIHRRDHAVVVLDAGHGGVDPGACGKVVRVCEKNVTLAMVKAVRDALRSDKIQVILTRDTDVYLPLRTRAQVAQKNSADLFVSLHADMYPTSHSVHGATVYMVSERASDREAARLANSENASDVMAGVALHDETPEVQHILLSLAQRDTLNNSVYLGRDVLKSLEGFTTLRKRNLLSAGFVVLKSPDVPSILVEMGYLSNPRDARNLMSEKYQKKLAKVIADGIRSYVDQHVHY